MVNFDALHGGMTATIECFCDIMIEENDMICCLTGQSGGAYPIGVS